jgi:hypothetical protein
MSSFRKPDLVPDLFSGRHSSLNAIYQSRLDFNDIVHTFFVKKILEVGEAGLMNAADEAFDVLCYIDPDSCSVGKGYFECVVEIFDCRGAVGFDVQQVIEARTKDRKRLNSFYFAFQLHHRCQRKVVRAFSEVNAFSRIVRGRIGITTEMHVMIGSGIVIE